VKVAVAMSGGVDSSVAAALLKKEGHEVIGITMRLRDEMGEVYSYQQPGGKLRSDVIQQSKSIADRLDITHVVADFRDVFRERIIGEFCREYSLGRTPNPCVRCNEYIKFDALLEKARGLGADYLATGHYARVERNSISNIFMLKKGTDGQKDQSYFLCRLNQQKLSRSMFPLGNMTKKKVKQLAEDLNIPVNERPESHEICFIPNNDYARFLEKYDPESIRPGPILNRQGDTISAHGGLHRYTIGQRKGLGIAAAEPLYVTAIERERNAVIVGKKDQTYGDELIVTDTNWIIGKLPEFPLHIKARIRYRHPEADATLFPLGKTSVHVKFARPQMAITPGQTIAFYDGDTVIGGGTINLKGSK
jgi:tRNA-specific 2-thiouridylase